MQLAEAHAPDGLRLFAVGDVHGRLDLLRETHARIAADLIRRPCAAFRVIHTGDYIDRGPDSAGVLDQLIEFCADGDGVCLAGNHDLYALGFLEDPVEVGEYWLRWGGLESLRSWGVSLEGFGHDLKSVRAARDALAEAMPERHLRFLRNLPFHERHGDYLFVHAGLRPGVALEKQKVSDVTFIREPFLSHEGDFGFVVVHGHTISDEPDIRRNRIGIDTGAYRSGVLTCLVLEGAEKGFLTAGGYAPFEPPR